MDDQNENPQENIITETNGSDNTTEDVGQTETDQNIEASIEQGNTEENAEDSSKDKDITESTKQENLPISINESTDPDSQVETEQKIEASSQIMEQENAEGSSKDNDISDSTKQENLLIPMNESSDPVTQETEDTAETIPSVDLGTKHEVLEAENAAEEKETKADEDVGASKEEVVFDESLEAVRNEAGAVIEEAPQDVPEPDVEEDTGISVQVNTTSSRTEDLNEEAIMDGDPAAVNNFQNDSPPTSPENKHSHSQSKKHIMVTVAHNGVEKEIKVEILNSAPRKPFLGGFRHRLNQTEYLNASCQTYPKKIYPSDVDRFNRDTQTVTTRNQLQQTQNNTSTQMTKPGCYISDLTDVVRIPGSYTTADEKESVRLEKVLILQSYWRRWLATRYVDRLRKDRELRIEWERVQAEEKAEEKTLRLQKEFERRMKPKTKADFDLLYAALERWRREETERINEMHSGPERKAALIGLLEQETYLIQSIERHRLNADKQNYEENVQSFLNKAASSKVWRAYDGGKTEMNTQHSLRAQELRDLYNSLQMTYLSQDERLDVLLTLKHTVKEYDCKLTQELMELIDREADLLTRGIKVGNLEGLRQRISTLFLQFCKTPLFNPEVSRLLKVPQDSSQLRKDIYFCPSCNSYLPSTEFPLASNSRIVGRCKKCTQLDNNARLRHDFTKIRCIMQHLRRTEEAYDDGSKTAFIIQDADLRYLIESIWNSQSALSGLDELYDLVFVRWNKHEHWSPWNCVLLTKQEASSHTKLDNVAEAYGRIFIGKIHHRHVLARQYFSKLTDVSDGLNKKGKHFNNTQNPMMTTVS